MKKVTLSMLVASGFMATAALVSVSAQAATPAASTPSNVGQSDANTAPQAPANASMPMQNSSMPSNVGSSDDVTPDTATGDDDY